MVEYSNKRLDCNGENLPLVVVSQIGQLKHAESLLKTIGLKSAEIAVLYTKKNMKMPEKIIDSIDKNIFCCSHLIEIHLGSGLPSIEVIIQNRKIYEKILDELKPKSLFICSYERHYSILCEEANKRNIELNLFEEGAGSFKGLVPGYVSFPTNPLRTSLSAVYKKVWKKSAFNKFFNRSNHRFTAKLRIIGLGVCSLPVLAFFTFREIQLLLDYSGRNRLPETYNKGWKKFNNVYSSSPDLMSKIFDAQHFIEVPLRFDNSSMIEKAKTIIEKYQIDSRTAIFTSQRYFVEQDAMVRCIVKSLKEVSSSLGYRVLIKLHPKEEEEVAAAYEAEIAANDLNNIEVIKNESIPAEYISIYSDSPAVISMASSTLIYAPKIKESLRSICIGKTVLLYLTREGVDTAGTRLINENLKIFDYIPYVEVFSNEYFDGAQ